MTPAGPARTARGSSRPTSPSRWGPPRRAASRSCATAGWCTSCSSRCRTRGRGSSSSPRPTTRCRPPAPRSSRCRWTTARASSGGSAAGRRALPGHHRRRPRDRARPTRCSAGASAPRELSPAPPPPRAHGVPARPPGLRARALAAGRARPRAGRPPDPGGSDPAARQGNPRGSSSRRARTLGRHATLARHPAGQSRARRGPALRLPGLGPARLTRLGQELERSAAAAGHGGQPAHAGRRAAWCARCCPSSTWWCSRTRTWPATWAR